MAVSVRCLFLNVPLVGLQCVIMHFLVKLTYFLKMSACRKMLVYPSVLYSFFLQIARVLDTVNSEFYFRE